MGCSTSAQQGSRDSVTVRSQGSEKDRPQASVKPTSQQNEKQKISPPPNKTDNLDVKSQKTNGGSSLGQDASLATNQNSVVTTVTPSKKKLGPNVLPKLGNVAENVKNLLYGRFHCVSEPSVKQDVIQFYHCAVAGDSSQERNKLLHGAYVKLRQTCAEHGFNLHVTDVNWPSNVKLQQSVAKTCLGDIEICLQNAWQTFFVVFLNDNYGASCPQSIESTHMAGLQSSLSSEAAALVNQLYKEDLNSVPPSYILQGPDITDMAEDEWLDNNDKLLKLLQENLPQEIRNQYLLSDFDRSITQGVLAKGIPATNVILVNRNFTGLPDDCSAAGLKQFRNILCQEVDSVSDDLLSDLRSRIEAKTVSDNVMKFETAWNDSTGVNDESYLNDLDKMFCELGTKLISDVVKEKKEQDKNLCGISRSLCNELMQQCARVHAINQTIQGRSDILARLTHYLDTGHVTRADVKTVLPLILHGESGSGKSTICGLLAETWQNVVGWEMGVCSTRLVDCSSMTKTMQAILYSICLQIDSAYGLGLAQYCKNGKQLSAAIKEVFSTQPPQHPLLVIIDGIDQLSDCDSTLPWLPRELPANVRIILSTSKPDLFKSAVTDDDYYIKVPSLNADECSAILGSILASCDRTLTNEQKDGIASTLQTQGSALNACLASTMACDVHSYSTEKFPGPNLKDLLNSFLENLENTFTNEIVSCVLSYLLCACDGLSDCEIVDLLFCDNRIEEAHKAGHLPRKKWPTLKRLMSPLLLCYPAQNTYVCAIANAAIRGNLQERYAVKLLASEEMLTKYFTRQLSSSCSLLDNRRCKNELKSLLASGNVENAKNLLFDFNWLSQKLKATGIFSLLCDLQTLAKADPGCGQVKVLEQALSQCTLSLATHPEHLALKLCTNLKPLVKPGDHPLLSALCDNVSGRYLLPSAETMAAHRQMTCDELKKPLITGIFRIPSLPTHVAATSTDKGEITVWHFESQKRMRQLTGIAMPRNIKMVDSHKAAVLCNRELKVYNLHTGTLQAKMKGVLNVKMPFYGIHDSDHVVALSRNRMYVNIMNMNTGDMAATFKVGEDRFLNSLLVSQNGETCVCGDEVQKPFPLLVWDLPNRKLIHDFRMAGHEFLTGVSSITNDGHYVVCVCKELDDPAPNFIIVYDIQSGQLFKKWKPDYNTTAIAISSESNLVVSACDDSSVLVWDMIAGSLKHQLTGHSMPVDTVKLSDDGQRAITYDSTGKDMAVFLWDLAAGCCLGIFSPDEPVTCCEISADGNTVLVAFMGDEQVIAVKPCDLGTEWNLGSTECYGDESQTEQCFDLSQAG